MRQGLIMTSRGIMEVYQADDGKITCNGIDDLLDMYDMGGLELFRTNNLDFLHIVLYNTDQGYPEYAIWWISADDDETLVWVGDTCD